MTSVDPAVPPAERPTDLPTARSAEQLGGFAVLQLTAWCALLVLAAEGALGAGGGRWLLGRSRRVRAARDRAHERLGAPAVAA